MSSSIRSASCTTTSDADALDSSAAPACVRMTTSPASVTWNPDWPADWQRHYAAARELPRDEDHTDVLPGVTIHAWTSANGSPGNASTPSGGSSWTDSANA
ncbi:hypothetical protein [Streptomyces brasiliensis]|nr:hypothetical protein [Streptomyces brasiliensis]